MPWTVDDVERHNKGLSTREKRQWVHVANGALESGDDDGTAITKANGVVKKGRVSESSEDDASSFANMLSDRAKKSKSKFDHQLAHGLHKAAAELQQSAGNTKLSKKHLKAAKYHATQKMIESILYKKASRLIEIVRMQEVATLLEADPRPRVEFDIDGKPVIPTRQQFTQYFQDMQAKHIKDAVDRAHDMWKSAKADDKKALDLEIEVGNEVLNQKSVSEAIKKKPAKKPEVNRTGRALHTAVDIASGGSPMANLIAGHLTKWLFKAK